ncbi:MAG: 3-hydroxyacyl-CoA dehydrogenase family protein [Deltaproteobacteria bacterium]|nr:3-hydroxyacyl-CoA dehydrogenase family protein [Deltaproteobacteria bacterium]MBW1950595.1 3-hydroxyacyl-CoA dehydrogenase family protein [Deltaproteobacteria bacterium]MBW2009486.1 3-hydroxyacyl-CoA dehydrogenase family protein [Deltaproteobacteria bacterium]MBW2101479.1 3-hydroxyacyl-CoA dehydrogenase family protein [Deltaproteobacteria bacterium]MBW2346998.1 3-hydroxyacyl-CoA dehydrogenase family protein [Deltaproteobacteria bacterium]
MDIKKVLVVGAGTMGNGIAQVCAQKGLSVVLSDISEKMLEKAVGNIRWSVSKFIEKGKVSEDLETIMGRIRTTQGFEAAGEADLVIEAVFEKIEVKHEVFKKIDEAAGPDTILASNTSAIPITQIASVVKRPENFVGLHFFNPVPMMMAVEVIRGISTTDETFQYGADFIRYIGKEPIMVHRDIAGFILNRINMVSNIEAIRLVEQGVATPEDIDKGMRLAFGRKMGPFETGDLVGLEVSLMAYTNVYEEEKDIRFYPPSLMRRKVLAGHLGRKAGRGWYEYNEDGTRKK